MKRKALLLLLSLLVVMSCVAPNDPLLTIEPAECTVVPSIVEFTAVGEIQSKGSKVSLTGYQFSIRRDSDGFSWTFYSEDGKLSFAFEKVGTYVVDVAVADSVGAKNIGSVKSLVSITDPFATYEWTSAVKKVYQKNPFELDASGIDAKNYFWQIFKPDSDAPNGYQIEPCWRGEGKTASCSGLAEVLDSYMVKLTVEDVYGNSRQYTDLLDVLNPLTPTPNGAVYSTLADGITKGELISDSTDPKPAYEHSVLLFDSSQTLAGVDPVKPLVITKVVWSIAIDGVFSQQLVASEKGVIAWTPTKSGFYTVSLKVFNDLGESSSIGDALSFWINKNVPVVSRYRLSTAPHFGGIFYEGQNMDLTVVASSPSAKNGRITSILWDFENRQVQDVTFVPPLENQTNTFTAPWKIFYSESSQSITYKGMIYVTNEAGWRSEGVPFSILVEDNNPIAQLALYPKPPIFSGSSIKLSSEGSRTKDGDTARFSIDMGLYNALGEKVDLDGTGSYTFASGDIQTYTAKLTVSNVNGSVTKEIPVDVIAPRLNASFLALYNHGFNDFFSGQTIVLDASASQTAAMAPIEAGNFQWKILFNAGAYTGGSDGAWQNDKISAHTESGKYNLQLGLAGVYKIQLKVRENSTSPWSPVCEEDIFVLDNVPVNLSIEIIGEEDISELGVEKTRYSFVGRGSSPDGSELTYKWYNDQIPLGSVTPDALGSTAAFAYRGGSHTVYLVVTNGGGTGVSIAISHTFETKDHLPPEAPVVSAVNERVGNGFPTWSWLPVDAGDVAGYRVKVDSGHWVETSGTSYTPSEEIAVASGSTKTVTLYVQAKDQFTNWSESASASIVIDKEPPAAPIVSTDYLNNITGDTTPDFKWEPADPADAESYRWQVNNELESGWVTTTEKMATITAALTKGTHQIYVQTKDSCGNWSISGILNIVIDLDPPEVPLVFTAVGYIDDYTNDTTPVWNFKAGNKQDTVEFKHRLVTPSGVTEWIFVPADPLVDDYTFTPTSPLGEDGEYSLWVHAKDAAGNWSEGAQRIIKLDTVKPEVPTVSGISPTQAQTIAFSWSSTDNPYRYRYKTAIGETWIVHPISMPNSYEVSNTSEGIYYIAVQAGDRAGNWSDSAEKNIVVDRTPQDPPIVRATFPLLFSGAASYSWDNANSSDPGVEFRYKVDDSVWNAGAGGYDESWTATFDSSVSVAISSEGQHHLYVRSKDGAGNWSNAGSAVVAWGKPTPAINSTVSFPYASIINIGNLTQTADAFFLDGMDVTSYVTVLSRSVNSAGIDSRKVKTYPGVVSYVIRDHKGGTCSVSGGAVKIEVPPNPTVLNGDFEVSSGTANEAVHWNLHFRGYQVHGSGGWGGYVNSNPATYSGDYACILGGVVDCKTYAGNGHVSIDGPDGSPTQAFFVPQSCMTKSAWLSSYYISRTMGTVRQANINIYKDVDYKLVVKTYKSKNSNQKWDSKINVEKMAGLEWALEPEANKDREHWGEWHTQEVSFKSANDGGIEVVLEKTDIDNGSRDAGACYFDDVTIVVTGYPQ